MKNLIKERPDNNLSGRLKFTTLFADGTAINNKTVLDIGCGFGWFELFCLKMNAQKIHGIEITEIDLTTVRKNISNSKCQFSVGSAIEIPFENNIFDTVFAWEVIEHIPNGSEQIMFREIKKCLKKGGAFYLSTPYKHIISNVMDPAWLLIGHRHYSYKDLQRLGEENGFEIVKYSVKGGAWTLLSVLNMYVAKWIFRRKRFYNDFFIRKENIEYDLNYNGYTNIFIKYVKI